MTIKFTPGRVCQGLVKYKIDRPHIKNQQQQSARRGHLVGLLSGRVEVGKRPIDWNHNVVEELNLGKG